MSVLVPMVSPLSAWDIEQQATSITEQFFPELLREPGRFPVLEFFDLLDEEFELETGVEELADGVEGITYPDGRVILSEKTYREAASGVGRARFTVVHEAYHGIRHRSQLQRMLIHNGGLVLHRRKSVAAYRDPEWQANVFASAVLMPAQMVRAAIADVGRCEAYVLTETFGVSLQAAEIRLRKLGLR